MEREDKLKAFVDKFFLAVGLSPKHRTANEIDWAAVQYLTPELQSLDTLQKVAEWMGGARGNRI